MATTLNLENKELKKRRHKEVLHNITIPPLSTHRNATSPRFFLYNLHTHSWAQWTCLTDPLFYICLYNSITKYFKCVHICFLHPDSLVCCFQFGNFQCELSLCKPISMLKVADHQPQGLLHLQIKVK